MAFVIEFLRAEVRGVRAIASGQARNSEPWRQFGQPMGGEPRASPNPCAYAGIWQAARAPKLRTLTVKQLLQGFNLQQFLSVLPEPPIS